MGNQILQILYEPLEKLSNSSEKTGHGERFQVIAEVCSRYNLTPMCVETPDRNLPLVVWGSSKAWVEGVFKKYKGMHLIYKGNPAVYAEHKACIIGENTAGEIEQILTYLTEANRMRIALLAPNCVHFDSVYYVRTFLAKASEMGIPIKDEDVFWDSGENETDPLLPGMPIESYNNFYPVYNRYDAVVCFNTQSAIYFCARAKQDGIRIPEDLYVIGRGNLRIASAVKPSITTISCNEEEVGQQIVRLYRYLLANPYVESATVLLNCSITPRKSTDNFQLQTKKDGETHALSTTKRVPSAVYQEIGQIEAMFRNCTNMDLRILDGVRHGVTREKLAEQEFTTISTVRYRLKRMLQLAGVETKKELFDVLDKYNIDISSFIPSN